MSDPTIEQFEKWAEVVTRYGLPLILLFVAGLALWKFFCWIRPHVEKLIANVERMFDSHNTLVDTLGNEAEKQTGAMEKQAQAFIGLNDGHKETHKRLDTVTDRLEAIESKLPPRPM